MARSLVTWSMARLVVWSMARLVVWSMARLVYMAPGTTLHDPPWVHPCTVPPVPVHAPATSGDFKMCYGL